MSANLITLSDVRCREIVWLVPGTIPRGMITILAGWPGLGKSLYTLMLAAERSLHHEDILISSAEDALEYTIKPRLKALDGRLDRIHALVPVDADGNPRAVSFPTDAGLLLSEIRSVGASLVIIDPFGAHLDDRVNSHNDASLRKAIAPLHRIAEETGAAVVLVLHLNKSEGSDPMRRLGGSIGGPGAARSALLLDRDPDDPDGAEGNRRVLAHFKSNIGKLQPSRQYEIREVLVPAGGGEPEVATARLVDLGESSHGAAELLTPSGERTLLDEAFDFLRAELADGAVVAADAIQKAAAKAGISGTTLHRASVKLRIDKKRTGFGSDGVWHWSIPSIDSIDSTVAPTLDCGIKEDLMESMAIDSIGAIDSTFQAGGEE